MATAMRGLTMFVSDIRNCTTKEQEQKRVDKEMAHIRSKLTAKLDGYGKKKYVWKLIYMFMLGYDIDFGHMESLQLISSTKYTEKVAGYMACSIMLNETSELLRLIIQSVKKDLAPTNEVFQCMALSCIANVGGTEFAAELAIDVQKVLVSPHTRSFARKKAALALLRLFRKNPEAVPQDDFPPKVIALLNTTQLGVATSVMSLLLGMVSHSPKGYEEAPTRAIQLLEKIALTIDKKSVYKYYVTICPWLQVKIMKLLQYFPPPEDKQVLSRLNHLLSEILNRTKITENVNKNNADHAILFEAINLIIHYCLNGSTELHSQAANLLAKFISIREPNFRYLGLETLARMAEVPGTLPTLKKQQTTIQFSLKDPDISIRKRALDLLYAMCDKSNAREIVNQLLKYLQSAQYDMREELVLKIAVLAENFAADLRWFVDVILQLISYAGDFVSEDVWYRVVQITTNNEDLQDYAATTCYKFLSSPSVHDTGIKVAAYVLGEFGHQIKDKSVTGNAIFDCLRLKWTTAGPKAKAIILTAYIKMGNTYPELKQSVEEVFKQCRATADPELQQRACEYSIFNGLNDAALLNKVFDVMPNFPERESILLKRLRKVTKGAETTKKDKEDGKQEGEASDSEGSDQEEGKTKKQPPKEAPQTKKQQKEESSDSEESEEEADDSIPFPPQHSKFLAALWTKDKGVLYESSALQVGMQSLIDNGSQVKMILYYGNKTASAIEDLVASLPNIEGLRVQARPSDKLSVPAKQQFKHMFLWESVKPFAEIPKLKLNFLHNGTAQELVLSVPVSVVSFVTNTDVAPQNFLPSWKSYVHECQVKRKLESVNVEELKTTFREALHMSVITGVEPNADNICASGTYHAGGGGQVLALPCLVRLETKPGIALVRLTVHSQSKVLSDALAAAITAVLNAAVV